MAKSSRSKTIDVECGPCKGTGIYKNFAEPDGVGVVCLNCNGSGKTKLTYRPFTVRKIRDDIKTVRLSAGSFIVTGIGPKGRSVSYKDFLSGKMPGKKR